MLGSTKPIKRSFPLKSSKQINIILAIEKYAREVFHELIRLETPITKKSTILSRYINAQTFSQVGLYHSHQYSKLSKLVSDRIFECISEAKKWSCPDLIQWLSIEIRSSPLEQREIVFRILDGNKDGLITKDDCVTVLSHALANPLSQSEQKCKQERNKVIKLVDSYFSGIQFADLQRFEAWYSEGKWELHDNIWDYITDTIMSREKLMNYMKLNSIAIAFSELEETIDEEVKEEDDLETTRCDSDSESTAICQGKLYRMTDSGCRSGYYRIVNSELYQFRKKEDHKHKLLCYLGHGACVVPFTPRIEASNGQKLFGLRLVSGQERIRFYTSFEPDFLRWKQAFEQVTGTKSEIFEDYTFQETLGYGKFGYVKKAVSNKTKQRVAIKVISKKEVDCRTISEEINVQRMCKHPNLLQILDVYEDEDHVYLVLELMEGGTLMEYIDSKKGTKTDILVTTCIIYQLALALKYLKQFNIVHRDVKALNVLLTGKQIEFEIGGMPVFAPEVKLSDFSVSTIISTGVKNEYCGTITHMAPQILQRLKYGHQVDMFSFGVVIYQCLTGKLPFFHHNDEKLKGQEQPYFSLIMYGQFSNMEELKLTIPSFLFRVIEKLLSKRPSNRLDIEELLSLPQFKAIFKP